MATTTTINGVDRIYGPRDFDLNKVRFTYENGIKIARVRFDATDLPVVADSIIVANAGDMLIQAQIKVITPLDSAGDNATLTMGLRTSADVEIDDDGIDAAIAEAALDTVDETVVCDGAMVDSMHDDGGEVTEDAYLYCTAANTPTAGVFELEIRMHPSLT